jgi:hypothetical protein
MTLATVEEASRLLYFLGLDLTADCADKNWSSATAGKIVSMWGRFATVFEAQEQSPIECDQRKKVSNPANASPHEHRPVAPVQAQKATLSREAESEES